MMSLYGKEGVCMVKREKRAMKRRKEYLKRSPLVGCQERRRSRLREMEVE